MNDTTIALRFIENNIRVDVGFLPCSEIYTAYQRFVENELKTLDERIRVQNTFLSCAAQNRSATFQVTYR